MSLFSSVILPHIEKELIALEPEIAKFFLGQIKSVSVDILNWVEKKTNNHQEAPAPKFCEDYIKNG